MSKIIQMSDGTTNLYPQTANQNWYYSGLLISADTDTSIAGYGAAHIQLLPSGIYQIDFEAKITTAGTNNTDFSTGILASVFTATVGKTLTPLGQAYTGMAQIFNSSGAMKINMMGNAFQTRAGANGTRWMFGRKYANSGSDFGSWGTSSYAVGDIICGTCYGS